MPVVFVSHGAATLTMDPGEKSYVDFAALGGEIGNLSPRAIILISAHDERAEFTVSTADTMAMVPDHPAATGQAWSGRGDFAVQEEVMAAILAKDLKAESGSPSLDHGAWIPLVHLFPDAGVPVISVSIRKDSDATAHYALGEALAPLAQKGLLILASGGATHNQDEFRSSYFAGNAPDHVEGFSNRFDRWVGDMLALSTNVRKTALLGASDHPDYAKSHPTPDHWMPMLVAAGAAGGRTSAPLTKGFQHSLSMAAYRFD
jgi:4,5-DOPA dioxygenase extradiol